MVLLASGLSLVLAIIWADRQIRAEAGPWCHPPTNPISHHRAALVLGTSPRLASGGTNVFFSNRLACAADLWRSGTVDYLLVSGDNRRVGYDEPTAMRDGLIALGVPAQRIYRDFAGDHTLDSVIRAEAIFGLRSFLVVSQREHVERAVYLARSRGLEAAGCIAQDPPFVGRVWLRERFSRLLAWIDAGLLRRNARVLGPPVRIGIDPG